MPDLLIFRPQIERRPTGIFVHLVSVTEPPPSAARAFKWSAGPFATEETAVEALRRKLRAKTVGGISFTIEVGTKRYAEPTQALRALSRERTSQD